MFSSADDLRRYEKLDDLEKLEQVTFSCSVATWIPRIASSPSQSN